MKTILIIGDSWGVPNYEGLPGDPPETHTEFRLRELGYKVYNCAFNGSSNIDTFTKARKFLKGEPVILEPTKLNNEALRPLSPYKFGIERTIDPDYHIDVVIWFHTEFFRTKNFDFVNRTIEENVVSGAHNDYKFAQIVLKEIPDSKLIVIGGQSPVVTDILYQYLNPDYLIEDWKNELLGPDLPKIHTLTKPENWIHPYKKGTQYKLEWINKTIQVRRAMAASPDFPDNCHPGSESHRKLTERLHEQITQMFKKE
jgi:hypothetical protein